MSPRRTRSSHRSCDRVSISAEEVEAVLSQHPGISSVVVVGIPDIRLTEKVVACITIKDDWEWLTENSGYSKERRIVSPEVLQKHCKQENLSRWYYREGDGQRE